MAGNDGGVITIHHPESGGQSKIPASAYPAFEVKGWKVGPRSAALEREFTARVNARNERLRKEREARRKARRAERQPARQNSKES